MQAPFEHTAAMTALLEHAYALARERSPDEQDRIARIILASVGDDEEEYVLTAEEAALIDERIAAADRGEYASNERLRSTFARYGVRYNG